MFLYDSDPEKNQWLITSCQHFYSQLAANITKTITQSTRYGKLYELDCRLRPTGKSGALAVSLPEFQRYFESGQGHFWERLALCKARTIFGHPELQRAATQSVRNAIGNKKWVPEVANQIREMRFKMQEDCSPRNLKRGIGGTVDIEFLVQTLQLKYFAESPAVLVPGTLDAITELAAANYLSDSDGSFLLESYEFLRAVEACLRLMNAAGRHELPQDESQLKKLAFLLKFDCSENLLHRIERFRQENREIFNRIFSQLIQKGA